MGRKKRKGFFYYGLINLIYGRDSFSRERLRQAKILNNQAVKDLPVTWMSFYAESHTSDKMSQLQHFFLKGRWTF